jgi:uncharacterized protein
MTTNSQTGRPAWREVVRRAAQGAAAAAHRFYGDSEDVLFSYRWEHVQVVVRLALRLAELSGADKEIVEAAAWLHDVAKLSKEEHGKDSALAARRILLETDYDRDKIDAVADAIVKHAWRPNPEPIAPIEAAVLWDADKLTKIGAISALLYTGFQIKARWRTMDHLVERLPHPRRDDIVAHLNTGPAQAAGRKRVEALEAFWRQAMRELDGDDLC